MGIKFSPQKVNRERNDNYGGKMKINFKIGAIVVIVIIIAIIIFGSVIYKLQANKIVGKWQSKTGYTIVFQSDGRYSGSSGQSGQYSLGGHKLRLFPDKGMGGPEVYNIVIYSDAIVISTEYPVRLNKIE